MRSLWRGAGESGADGGRGGFPGALRVAVIEVVTVAVARIHAMATAGAAIAVGSAALLASAPAVPAQELTRARLLNTTATTDAWEDRDPSIATDGKGNWLAVWETLGDLEHGKPGKAWTIAITRSVDDAKTWTPPAPLIDSAGGQRSRGADNNAVVASDGRGNWIVAWESIGPSTGGDSDILFSHSADIGSTWSQPRPIAAFAASDAGQDFHPALLPLVDGTIVAAWESSGGVDGSGRDFDILVTRSTDGGRHFGVPGLLDAAARTDRDSDRKVTLAADARGNVLAAWETFAGEGLGTDWDILVARSGDDGRTWSPSAPLSRFAAVDRGTPDRDVSLAADVEGRWLAVWASPLALASPAKGCGSDPAGDVATACAALPAPDGDWDIWQAASADGGSSWSVPRRLAASMDTDHVRDEAPAIAGLVAGAFVVAWQTQGFEGRGDDTDPAVCFLPAGQQTAGPVLAAAAYAGGDGTSRDGPPRVIAAPAAAAIVWAGDYNGDAAAAHDLDLRFVRVTAK